VLVSGIVERIGETDSFVTHRRHLSTTGVNEVREHCTAANHAAGLKTIQAKLQQDSGFNPSTIGAIGHRVVHGGESFSAPALVDQDVVEGIRRMIPLAPLHNPANLTGIEVCLAVLPNIPQVAVFDTAFHHTMPMWAYRYALPENLYTDHGIRRYGFHGTSHYYVAKQAAAYLGSTLDSLRLITLHLGNGASAAAIKNGNCIDTSMGMTPLEGLVMGTRSGDIDPSIPGFLAGTAKLNYQQIDSLLNKESGLKGICGSNDMREILQRCDTADKRAELAVAMYCYRIKKYIGAYTAAMNGVDAIVFTGGVGENAPAIRQKVCVDLNALGINIDPDKNQHGSGDVFDFHASDSKSSLLAVATNEELEIAAQTLHCLTTQTSAT
jgi:acetate kinase